MKIALLMIVFSILASLQGRFIRKGRWLVEGKVPNHWMGHSVWGIFWVVTGALLFGIITFDQWVALFLLFLASFPGIYLAGIHDWKETNLKQSILDELTKIYQTYYRENNHGKSRY